VPPRDDVKPELVQHWIPNGFEMDEGYGSARVAGLIVETNGAALKAECLKWLREHDLEIRLVPNPPGLWGDRA
jgi:hypothetical protein